MELGCVGFGDQLTTGSLKVERYLKIIRASSATFRTSLGLIFPKELITNAISSWSPPLTKSAPLPKSLCSPSNATNGRKNKD